MEATVKDVKYGEAFWRAIALIIVAVCLLISMPIWAQRHHFVSYTVKDGLAQSQVRDIIQSRDGHLWIATIGGVSKFDGQNFTNYNKSNGLLNNVITAIHETSDESIIIACQGGIVRITSDGIKKFPFSSKYSETIVFDIIEYDEKIWLATNGAGLLIWENGIVDSVQFESKAENFIRSLSVWNENLLVGSKKGLMQLNESDHSWIIKNSSINKVTTYQNEIWTATTKFGIYFIDDADTIHLTDSNGLTSPFQKDISIDQNGTTWFITKNGIATYNREAKSVDQVLPTDIAQIDNLKVIFSDKSNNIWLGTSGSGMLKYTGSYTVSYGIADGFPSDQIMAIEQDQEGNMWFGSYGAGVSVVDNGTISTFEFEDGLNNNTIWSLESINDQMWVGTSDGMNIIEDGIIKDFPLNDSLPFTRVSSIFNDSKNNQWIGTRDGLLRITNLKVSTPLALKQLQLTEVKSFHQKDDIIWISSRSGLIGWNQKLHQIVDPKSEDLNNVYISSLTNTGNIIWAGTDDGIYGYDRLNNEINHLTISEKPSANIVNFLASDALNNIWIGTDNGLFSLNKDEDDFSIRSYSEHDGIIVQECNQNAAFLANNGTLWFGLNGSLVNINPLEIPDQTIRNERAKLMELLLNFESIDPSKYYDDELEKLVFDYQENRITIRFSAVHFTNPEKLEYSYRLSGSGEEWSPANQDNSVTYASLQPGDYEFRARIKLENTEWGLTTSLVKFKILPPFYQTWWFILISIALAGMLTYLMYKQIKRREERKQAMLSVQNQAKILGLEQQTLNAHMNRHFIFNALNSIQYYINTKEKKLANSYLTQFAALVRKNLDSAQEQNIALEDEIERLKLYMNLEQMRFKDRFDYTINVEQDIDIGHLQVPSMILQPFVENSIMHGILPSEKHGEIEISIYSEHESIIFQIADNGIGIEKSVEQKPSTSHHVSNGMKITKQRLEVLSSIQSENYGVVGPEERKNESGQSTGTIVIIRLPKLYKTS